MVTLGKIIDEYKSRLSEYCDRVLERDDKVAVDKLQMRLDQIRTVVKMKWEEAEAENRLSYQTLAEGKQRLDEVWTGVRESTLADLDPRVPEHLLNDLRSIVDLYIAKELGEAGLTALIAEEASAHSDDGSISEKLFAYTQERLRSALEQVKGSAMEDFDPRTKLGLKRTGVLFGNLFAGKIAATAGGISLATEKGIGYVRQKLRKSEP